MAAHAAPNREDHKIYMLFTVCEVLCVFLPVLVHVLVASLGAVEEPAPGPDSPPGGAHKTLVDLPEWLYAAVVLSGLSACKYLVAYFMTARRHLRRSRVFFRVLIAGGHSVISAIVLGLFFHRAHHDLWWAVIEATLCVTGIFIFVVASSDYFGLTHPES